MLIAIGAVNVWHGIYAPAKQARKLLMIGNSVTTELSEQESRLRQTLMNAVTLQKAAIQDLSQQLQICQSSTQATPTEIHDLLKRIQIERSCLNELYAEINTLESKAGR